MLLGPIEGNGDCFLQAVLAGCIYELDRAVEGKEDDPRKETIKSLTSTIVRKAVVDYLKEALLAE